LSKKPTEESKRTRTLTGPVGMLAFLLAVGLGLFHIYTGGFGAVSAMAQRAIHWTVLSFLVFLYYPASGRSKGQTTVFDYAWALTAAVSGLYILFNWNRIAQNAGITNSTDILMGVVAVVVVLEATRRVVGPVLATIGGLFLLYGYFGAWLPGYFGHRPYSLERIISFMYTSTEGIFGIPMSVSASYVALFVIFGAILEKFGGGEFFVNLAFAITGKLRGGPAKAAIVSSGLMGTMSGSAVANVVTTGAFTIPLMKRAGYKPHVAGAIEAAASTGGQIMPPVMGAAAFLMAEMTGIKYLEIMKAALIPALLYFFAVYLMVDFEAGKEDITADSSVSPGLKATLIKRGYLLIPLFVLIGFLLAGFSPMKSVVWAAVSVLLLTFVFDRDRFKIVPNFLDALNKGINNTINIAVACACSGLIVGVIALTGLGLKFSSLIVSFSGTNILPALVLTMLASLVLGFGLPTTAAYVVLATLGAPALVQLGIPVLAAHMFVFYFGCISTITPPVALSAYGGAALAGANPNTVGWTAFKFGIVGFLVPYMWIYGPGLLLMAPPLKVVQVICTSIIGVIAVAASLQGFALTRLSRVERVMGFIAGVSMINAELVTDMLGLAVLVPLALSQLSRTRKKGVPV